MSLVIALGSNLGDRKNNLDLAIKSLTEYFGLVISKSQIYQTEPYGDIPQDDFYNMCIEFGLPSITPEKTLEICLSIESSLGRAREVKWGPRNIDIDILYFGDTQVNTDDLIIPHPHILERSFVVLPLKDLKCFDSLSKKYNYPDNFSTKSIVIKI